MGISLGPSRVSVIAERHPYWKEVPVNSGSTALCSAIVSSIFCKLKFR